jgi:hypothetical protein
MSPQWNFRRSTDHISPHSQRISASGDDRIDGLYTQLVAEVGDCRDFEHRHREFATACGVEMPTPIAPSHDALSDVALMTWRARVQSILNPPAPQTVQRREPNILVLD